jgi:hypothetical protein
MMYGKDKKVAMAKGGMAKKEMPKGFMPKAKPAKKPGKK